MLGAVDRVGEAVLDRQWVRDRAVALNDGFQRVPVLEFDDGSVLVEPTNEQLAAKLKIE